MARERPLSPHLQIYRLPLPALMSISHRLCGLALAAGSLLVVWYLAALAAGPAYFAFLQTVLASWYGQLVLFGYSAAVLYHLGNGVRHLLWDFGYGLSLDGVYRGGYAVIVWTVALTAGLWLLALAPRVAA